MNENSSISELKGIGEKTEQYFHKLGVKTIGDLLRYYPRGYDVYEAPALIENAQTGMTSTISGIISAKPQVGGSRNMQITTISVKDSSGILKVVWFRMPFLKNTLEKGQEILLRGRIIEKKGQRMMEHPEIFSPIQTYESKLDTLQPIYPLTSGLTNNAMIKAMKQAIEYLDLSQDFIWLNIIMQ